jgi:hypothetical protein
MMKMKMRKTKTMVNSSKMKKKITTRVRKMTKSMICPSAISTTNNNSNSKGNNSVHSRIKLWKMKMINTKMPMKERRTMMIRTTKKKMTRTMTRRLER